MLVSFQTGMFLEPLSQIVGKVSVGSVKMDVPVEKVRWFRQADLRAKSDSVNSSSEVWLRFLVRGLAQPTKTLTVRDNIR